MRDRLVVAFVGLALVVLALLAIPRAYFVAGLVNDQEEASTQRAAILIAAAVDSRETQGTSVTQAQLAALLTRGESVLYVAADGSEVEAGTPSSGSVVTEQLSSGGSITLTHSDAIVSERVTDALLPLVPLVLGLAVSAGLVGFVIAGRLARPFRELADATDDFRAAGPPPRLPHYSIPEAERLRIALLGAAQRISTHVRRERDISVQASHELRTPVAALRLSLEDLALWRETHPVVAEELQRSVVELDRLSTAITTLLDQPHDDAEQLDVDLCALVRHGVDTWRGRTADPVGELHVEADDRLPTRLVPADVLTVLTAMLDEAATGGTGRVDVAVHDSPGQLHVHVGDGGPRRLEPGPLHGPVPGDDDPLLTAAEVAEALGGHLVVDAGDRHRLTLTLPARTPATPVA